MDITIASPALSGPDSIWQSTGISGHMGGSRATERLLKMASTAPGHRVIEMGCGTGHTACTIAKRGMEVIAVDIDPGMLSGAKARAARSGTQDRICLIQADLHHLPFKEGTFDIALAESVLAYCDADRVSAEAFRVLKPGGTIGINELTYLRAPDPALKAMLRHMLRISLLQEREWKATLQKAGFAGVVAIVSKISLPGQFLSRLRMNGPAAFGRSLARGLFKPAITRALVNPKMPGIVMKYRSYVGYGLYTGRKP